ncbi:MAG TPA: hypothetical protein DCX89_09355 [Saprospirales bacterium]|nr:hypothetical protein [Saprospirales bacterium]
MKILHLLSLTFFIVVSGFLSCETYLDPREFETSPKMVVHSFFTPGQPWEFELSASLNVLNDTAIQIWLDSAIITISGDDGSLVDEFQYEGFGKYSSGQDLPIAGVTYTLTIQHEGYPDISATDKIPVANDPEDFKLQQIELNGKPWMQMSARLSPEDIFYQIIINNQITKTYLKDTGELLVFDELAFIKPASNSVNLFFQFDKGNQLSQKLFLNQWTNHDFSVLSEGGFRKINDTHLIQATSKWYFYYGSEAYYKYHLIKERADVFPGNNVGNVFLKSDHYSNI